MSPVLDQKINSKLSQIDDIQNELKILKSYIFKIYPAEEKELFQAYQEIISGQTANFDDLMDDLAKDKNAKK